MEPSGVQSASSYQSFRDVPSGADHACPSLRAMTRASCRPGVGRPPHATTSGSNERRLKASAQAGETTRRLQTMPGVGPITALAIESLAPPSTTVRRGRDFAARLGLVPRRHSTGGNSRPGRVSGIGRRDIRRLLIVGAMAVVRAAARKGAPEGSRLARMPARKPRMLVAIAPADKMARGLRAMASRQEQYRNPAAQAA